LKKKSSHQIPIDDNTNVQANNNNCGIESIITTAANIGGRRDVILKTVGYDKIFLKYVNYRLKILTLFN